MNKCECWHETPGRKWANAECWGTRERDPCSCGGNQTRCDFYPEVRERAKNEQREMRRKISEAFWAKKDDEAFKMLRDAGVELNNPDGSFKTLYEVLVNIADMLSSGNKAKSAAKAKLVHFGSARPYCGETWFCSACGCELEIPEDHDLPDTCPDCGAEFNHRPDIQAAIAYYSKGINEDIFSPEVAEYATLAIEGLRKMAENEK